MVPILALLVRVESS